jgi:mRNA interferase RelE/StbE
MYELILSDEAKHQLVKLNEHLQERIGVALERIKIRPHDFVKRMYNNKYYRARIDNYRIILDVLDTQLIIYVIDIDTRGNIYKKY